MIEDETRSTTDTSSNQRNTKHNFASSNSQIMEMLHDEIMRQLEFAWEAERKLVALCMPHDPKKPVSEASEVSSKPHTLISKSTTTSGNKANGSDHS